MRFGRIDRLLLFGGGSLPAALAVSAKSSGWPVSVVTSPRHANEPVKPDGVPLVSFLGQHGIDHTVTNDINTDASVHAQITPSTLAISMGAAWIFKASFIERFAGRLVNVHGARLPQDRGGGGYSWRILMGDRLGYSLIHLVDPGVDTGDVVTVDEYVFPPSCRTPADHQRHALEQDLGMLHRFLVDVRGDKGFVLQSQPEHLSSYWPRLNTDVHAFIDWSWGYADIERFVCAFDDPYAGAQTFIADRKVRLKECFSLTSDGAFHPFQAGIVYRVYAGKVFIAAGQGSVVVSRVTDDSGTEVLPSIRVGDRFHTPVGHLDAARQFRAVYTPHGLKA